MTDIDIWAKILRDADDSTSDSSEDLTKDAKLSFYKRMTAKQVLDLLKEAVPAYNRDYEMKFTDLKSGKSSQNIRLSFKVDDVNEVVEVFYDFK